MSSCFFVVKTAFIPLVVMYIVWIYGTIVGKISTPIEISKKNGRDRAASDVLQPMLVNPNNEQSW
jgi:hypothetical protein